MYDPLYLSYGSRLEVKIPQLCSSAIYEQNVSISLHLSNSVQCRRGYYFRAWMLYFSFETYKDVIIVACIHAIYKYGHAWVI